LPLPPWEFEESLSSWAPASALLPIDDKGFVYSRRALIVDATIMTKSLICAFMRDPLRAHVRPQSPPDMRIRQRILSRHCVLAVP
jgi:hypothetical protein